VDVNACSSELAAVIQLLSWCRGALAKDTYCESEQRGVRLGSGSSLRTQLSGTSRVPPADLQSLDTIKNLVVVRLMSYLGHRS
jgi:hypothetical protein